MHDEATTLFGRPSRAARRKLEEATHQQLADSLAIIDEHLTGKQRKTRRAVFLVLFELCRNHWAARGAEWAPAERRWLAAEAGVHVETLDAAVRDLEHLGLVERKRRRLHYTMSLSNLWRLAGCAALQRGKADTSTEISLSLARTIQGSLEAAPATNKNRSRLGRKRVGALPREFRWSTGPANHPALVGASVRVRKLAAEIYELARARLIDVGNVEQLSEGQWLSAIRDWLEDRELENDEISIDDVEAALDELAVWLDEGGSLAYSFRWMHQHRRKRRLPPSLIFGLYCGDDRDRSQGESPFWFWAEGARW